MSDLIEFCSRNGVPLQIKNAVASNIAAVEDAAAREILCKIQPTLDAELKRLKVIHYLKCLFKVSLGVEVFPYGSVPLRTYILDGDIDLTVFSLPNTENALFSHVYALLRQEEEHNKDSHYRVKDVQQIDAEVKLVKCIIQNFVVDISFSQLGGIQKLCFLEQVDRMVGRDHLFKRSVILLKSWCYYESRILGARQSLLSTYALETLALHILQLFHSSLDGPIAVLYRCLDYYSTFNWENYCISFSGPVSISSLPDMAGDLPESGKDGLLLNKEFLRNFTKMLTIPLKRSEINSRQFSLKHLNIIDPLKVDNNLGRSVSRGNFFRIRSAFKHGAQKLGEILVLPRDRVEDELKRFFANTLRRHKVISADEHSSAVIHGGRGSIGQILSSQNKIFLEDTSLSEPRTATCKEKRSKMATGILQPPKGVTSCWVAKSECPAITNIVSAPRAAKEHEIKRNFANKVCHQERPMGFSSEYDARQSKEPLFAAGKFCCEYEHSTCPSSAISIETSKMLLDLSGDYNGHIESLLYGQFCLDHASQPLLPASLWSPQLQAYNLLSRYPHMNTSDVNGQVQSVSHPTPSSTTVVSREKKRHSEIGVHLPTMNCCQFEFQPSYGRDRNQLMWTKGLSQCQTSSNCLAAAQQVSRPADKTGIGEKNCHLLRDRNINSNSPNVMA